MTFEELMKKTMSDPSLIWAASSVGIQILQTIFIVVSAVVVFIQIRQFQRESIKNKIDGLRTALDILNSDVFHQVSRQSMEGKAIQGVSWRKLFEDINLVGLLIEKDYTDEELLLSIKGAGLASIGIYLQGTQASSELKETLTRYEKGVKLMKHAIEMTNAKSK